MDNRALLMGLGIGAGLAFLFEPASGDRRSALIRDKLVRASRVNCGTADATAGDLANRTRGVMAVIRGRLRGTVEPSRLVERVRARLGRACSHPRAIDVEADADGTVTLHGVILAHELDDILATTAAVRGVTSIVNELEAHENSAGIPSLQGEGRIGGPNADLLQPKWAPATRALVGASALAAAVSAVAFARR
jgi:hypothetical protein